MSGNIPLLPLCVFIALAGTSLTVPLGLCLNRARKCSANLEDKGADPPEQCFSTVGPRPGTGPWHQLYRVARDSPGIDN